MFNFWYFFWIVVAIGSFVGLYFLLRNKQMRTKKIVLFSVLVFAVILHFVKLLFPPFSLNIDRLYRDSWFINICAANIALFPIFFLVKNKYVKDYMFYIGILGGAIAVVFPLEVTQKADQLLEWYNVIRFYIHHIILWVVPLLMVVFKIHTLSYRRIFAVPVTFVCVLCFIVINQILQSELGFIPLRGEDFFNINYKNSSMIWGPVGKIGDILAVFCPDIFKFVPVGELAGQVKYWPIIWLVFPMYVVLIPTEFLMCLATDYKKVCSDIKGDFKYVKAMLNK